MKNFLFFPLILCCVLAGPSMGQCSQKPEDINPCDLIAIGKIITTFPALKKAKNETIGRSSVCNYLDKYDIPALAVSVSQAGLHARDSLSMLDSSYKIENINGLGEDAAIAVQQANPKIGLQTGIAALHIKKKSISLNISFFRISIQQNTTEFERVKSLAEEMLEKL